MTASNKVRLRFAKSGDLRLVSHHDLMRCLERMVRRAALPVAQTQGFNPRPRIVFTLALALGIEGRREIVDIELSEPMEATEVLTRLQISAPPGFDWLMSGSVGPGRSAQAGIVHYMLENLPADRRTDAIRSVAQFLASTSWPHLRHRPGREVALDLRPFVDGAELDPSGTLRFRMKILPTGSARPEEFLEVLELRDLLEQGSILIRTEVELISCTSQASQAFVDDPIPSSPSNVEAPNPNNSHRESVRKTTA